jgi:membrane protease YdiL (CAAX protease family)
MQNKSFFCDFIKRFPVPLLLALFFLIPPLHLFIIPYYFGQKNSFDQVLKFGLQRLNIYIIVYIIICILAINFLSGYLLFDYSLQNNVNLLTVSQKITISQLFSIVVLAPIIEEFYFRGILLKYFEKTKCKFFILIATSLIFTLIHFNIPSSPTLFALGIFLAYLKIITGSLFLPIIMHSIFNCIMLLMIL